jgi:N-acyl-D-amino-acid deacylase
MGHNYYDLVIKNGHVIDGTGRPSFKANIYIDEGKIAKVDPDGQEFGDRVIDAKGMIVSPGFIDMHNHSEGTIFANKRAESYIRQGVTTLYINPDGFSPAPVVANHKKDLEDFYGALSFGAEMPYTWTTFKEYFNKLESGLGINIRANVGFGTVRICTMGFEMREPTDSEMEFMKQLVDQAFRDGVCGLSTGLTYHPQCYSNSEEVLELCNIVAKHGGIYHTHLRGVDGLKEAFWLGKKSGVPVHLTHSTPSDERYEIIERAKSTGLDVTLDAYPYTVGSGRMDAYLPGWVHEGGRDEMLARIQKPEVREKIKHDWKKKDPEAWPNGSSGTPLIAWCKNDRCKQYEGKTVNEVAEITDMNVVETFCSLLLENDGNVIHNSLGRRLRRDVQRAFQRPLMLVGSDGWAMATYGSLHVGYPHPRSYGTYPRILGTYVKLMDLLSLENAIKIMTLQSASRMKVYDRGAIQTGMWADITIFDPESITDNATYTFPHRYPTGVEYVIVNGEITIEKSKHTGALAGKILRYQSKAK